ncbi:MAG: DnaB-like helicase N-terminal domain-containing protein [Nitrospirota bacterium]|nr:DnaB-like helicase N-terminal domain-containing protein [Nitrospirota bacterium]
MRGVQESRTSSDIMERQALSCLMQNPSLIRDFPVEASHFSREGYRQLFAVLAERHEEGESLDPSSLFRSASEKGLLTFLGTPEDFEDFYYLCATTATFPYFFGKLQELKNLRSLALKSREIEERIKKGQDSSDILASLKKTVESLSGSLESTKTSERIDPFSLLPDILSLYKGESGHGYTTGWHSLDDHFKIFPNYLTLVTGIPGHGKTAWTDALLVNLARLHGWRSVIFSAEYMPLEDHIAALLELHSGRPFFEGPHMRMSESEIREGIDFISRHFAFLDPEVPTLDRILDLAETEIEKNGGNVLVIDPWNEIQHQYGTLTETLYISESLRRIRRFARKHSLHVFLVAHPQKLHKDPSGEYPVPTPYDISGGANWRNKADNCISIYRRIENGFERPETEVHIGKLKLRKFGTIGMVRLGFDRPTGRYISLST